MVDRDAAVHFCPCARLRVGIGNKGREARIRQLVADNGGIELAVEKHLHQRLALRRPRDEIGVLEFGEMRILECNPVDLRGSTP